MKKYLSIAAFVALAACTGKPGPRDALLSERKLVLETFFEGTSIARGQFQDVFGTVRRRFDVEITGTWTGETLILVEDFVYEDGATEQRIWTLVKTGADSWQGTAR